MKAVRLTWYEILQAAEIGCAQRVSALRDGRAQFTAGSPGWNEAIAGALGEIALALYLDRFWRPVYSSLDTQRGDVAGLQCKARWKAEGELIVGADANPDDVFVLVTLGALPVCRIAGWIYGRDAKRRSWYRENPGYRPAYFVPQPELESLESLPDFDRQAAA